MVGVKHVATALVIVALPTLVVDGRPKHPPQLPSSIRADLDRRFGTWPFNETAEELRKWFSTSKQGADPNLISGDFNGDGLRDYAMQIITTSSGSAVRRVLVYLRRGKGYRQRTLTTGKPSTELFLLLMRRGTKDYNYTRQREFRYKLDTIGLSPKRVVPATSIETAGSTPRSPVTRRGRTNDCSGARAARLDRATF